MMKSLACIFWEAGVQLLPHGNVDPSRNRILAGCWKKTALMQKSKCSHELKMSSTSSGLKSQK